MSKNEFVNAIKASEELAKDDMKNFQKLFDAINNIIPNSNDT